MGQMADLINAYYGEGVYDVYAAPFPAAEYAWLAVVLLVAGLALWQARAFVAQF